MKCKVLIYLLLLGLIKPGFSDDVSVSLGSSAVLNCSFTLIPVVDNSLLSITWSFNGSVIASKNHTQPGFFLNTTAFIIGSFPLTVYNITLDQQGVYACSVRYNDTEDSTDVTLTILVPPLVSINSPEVVLKRESVIECWAKGFSPPQIMFTWIRAGEKIPAPHKLQVNRTEDGLYDAVSWLTFIPELSDQNTTFGCEVQHTALVKPTTREFKPRIIVLPKVTLSTVPSATHTSPLTLSCEITSFYPHNISVLWIKNGEALPKHPLAVQNEYGMYRTHQYYTLSLEERNRGGEVQCVAQQPHVSEPAYGTIDLTTLDPRGEKKYGPFHSATYTPCNSRVSVVSEKGPLLSSTAAGYYKLHTQLPLRSSSGSNKQLFSSLTFIPNLSIHKGTVFKCQISYKGKDKTVAERVSDKFTILAPPEVSEIQFSETNGEGGVVTLTAQAAHFHPDIITFRWFCEGGELCPVSVPPALAAPRPDAEGFFSAASQCRLPRAELERGETRVWVTVHHMALKQPITRETRGFIKKPTVSEITSSPFPSTEERPLTLACDITGFYPPEISVKWLHLKENVIEEEESKVEMKERAEVWGPLQILPRTFRAKAFLKEVDTEMREGEIVCRVTHCSLLKPIERVWQNTQTVAPSIPPSLSVRWGSDGVRIFSILLIGGNPNAELLWAGGGTTVFKLLSKEREKINSEGILEIKSVCAVMKFTGRQDSDIRRGGHTHKYKMRNECVDGMKSVKEDQQPEQSIEKNNQDGDMEVDPSYINSVSLRNKFERLRVTVEITHPALSFPAYLTWTEPIEDTSS